MLFCHAGSEVFYAFRNGTENWASPEAAMALSGNIPFTKNTQPGWLKSGKPYDLVVYFADTEEEIRDLLSIEPLETITNHIKSKALFIEVLTRKEFIGQSNIAEIQPLIRKQALPDNPLLLFNFYEKLFASEVKLMSAKQEFGNLTFSINASGKIDPEEHKQLIKILNAFVDAGFCPVHSQNSSLTINFHGSKQQQTTSILKENLTGMQIDFHSSLTSATTNSGSSLQACFTRHGIEVRKTDQIRLLPDIDGQQALHRFTELVKYELKIKSKGNHLQ
ncbi:MAG: hypothetical protein Kow0029_08020 [Candidatus Rifleibacteriota bacterium]